MAQKQNTIWKSYYLKCKLNKYVLTETLNCVNVGHAQMDGGRELNKIGAAMENDLSPYVTSFERGTFRRMWQIDV